MIIETRPGKTVWNGGEAVEDSVLILAGLPII